MLAKKVIHSPSVLALLLALLSLLSVESCAQGNTSEILASGDKLQQVYSDDKFFEGPCWDKATGKLYFCAWLDGESQILRLDSPGVATVLRDDKGYGVNGLFLSNINQRLLAANAYGHTITSYKITDKGLVDKRVLVDDSSLNQPNDLCQTRRGDIYFTDPDWKNKKTSAVYRRNLVGVVTKEITDMTTPNGIIANNAGDALYVSDSTEKLWRVYDINSDGSVGKGRVFFNPHSDKPGAPDGMTIDKNGNLYLSGLGGVRIVSSEGKLLKMIPIAQIATNVTLGGTDNKTLYVTCKSKVYSIRLGEPKLQRNK